MAWESTAQLVSPARRTALKELGLTRLHGRQNRRHTGELGIEVARVRRARDLRLEGRLYTLVVHVVPVDVAEEGLAHDLLRIRRPASQALVGFAGEQLLENRDGVAGHVDGVQGLVCEDGVVDLVFVFAAERRLLEKHLVNENPERPPVDGAAVLLVQQDLSGLGMIAFTEEKRPTSGAMNSGVPQNVLVVDPYHMSSLHRP